jgi:hypothetical protein
MRPVRVAASALPVLLLVFAASFALAQNPCAHVVCPVGQACYGGTCMDPLCAGVVCDSNTSCLGGRCVPNYWLDVSPPNIDFGSEWIPYACTRVITITNQGVNPVTINNVSLGPVNPPLHPPSSFSIAVHPRLPITLSRGAQAQVDVFYAPTNGSPASGAVTLALTPSSCRINVNPVPLKGSGGVQAPKRAWDDIVVPLARSLSFGSKTQPDWASFTGLFSANAQVVSKLSPTPMTVAAFKAALLQVKPQYQSALFEPLKATIVLRGGCGQDHSIAGEFTAGLVEQTRSQLGQSQLQNAKTNGAFLIVQDSSGLIKRLEITSAKKLQAF